jgi:hypothetical protein
MVPEPEIRCPWTFEDLCLWTYCLVDDLWERIAPQCRRPGPAPVCSDPELVTMSLIGECKGWDRETVLVSEWAQHRDLFPHQPERTRFNRRRRQLQGAINELRRLLLGVLDLAQDRQVVLDSLPVPVVNFHLVPRGHARARWQAAGAAFGKVASKKITIFGFRLYLLVTLNGLILDFVLAPANLPELQVGAELLEEHTDLTAFSDKAWVSAPLVERLKEENRLWLWTVPRRNEQRTVPDEVKAHLHTVRQVIETVNSQLTEQFHLETNHAQGFWGLTARLHTKLTAHTLCVHLNRLRGSAHPLRIKHLAFPPPI